MEVGRSESPFEGLQLLHRLLNIDHSDLVGRSESPFEGLQRYTNRPKAYIAFNVGRSESPFEGLQLRRVSRHATRMAGSEEAKARLRDCNNLPLLTWLLRAQGRKKRKPV